MRRVYKADSVHYVTPTEDNEKQAAGMQALGIYAQVNAEVGHIIVAEVDHDRVKTLLKPDRSELGKLIRKE